MSVPLSIERKLKPGERLPQMRVLSQLHPAGRARVVRGAGRARRAGGVLPVGARHEGRSVCGRAAGHPARMVLPGDVPHAEAAAQPRARHRGRAAGRRGVRDGGGVPDPGAVPRSAGQPRRAKPGVHGSGGARSRLSRRRSRSSATTRSSAPCITRRLCRSPKASRSSCRRRRRVRRRPRLSRAVARARRLLGRSSRDGCSAPAARQHVRRLPRDDSDQRVATPAALFSASDIHRESGSRASTATAGMPRPPTRRGAHDPAQRFKGRPAGQAIVETCARCHSDATFMRGFAPRQRVDQATEYAASVHGQQLAKGDHNVATCASCHGAHGIRRVSDAKSPVFPTNVANTCAACHADTARMQRLQAAGRLAAADAASSPTSRRACTTPR